MTTRHCKTPAREIELPPELSFASPARFLTSMAPGAAPAKIIERIRQTVCTDTPAASWASEDPHRNL